LSNFQQTSYQAIHNPPLIQSPSHSLDFLSIGIPHATSFPADPDPRSQQSFVQPPNLRPPPTFPVAIRIPNCYLQHILQLPTAYYEYGETIGIATSFLIDAGSMMYRMHLSTGVSFTINAGFVQIIDKNEGNKTSEEERKNNIIDSHEYEQYGHPSSYENPSSSEEEMFWLEEVLHAPTQDLHDRIGDEEDHVTRLQRDFINMQERVGGDDAASRRRDRLQEEAVAA
jgi:hypothetical protein